MILLNVQIVNTIPMISVLQYIMKCIKKNIVASTITTDSVIIARNLVVLLGQY